MSASAAIDCPRRSLAFSPPLSKGGQGGSRGMVMTHSWPDSPYERNEFRPESDLDEFDSQQVFLPGSPYHSATRPPLPPLPKGGRKGLPCGLRWLVALLIVFTFALAGCNQSTGKDGQSGAPPDDAIERTAEKGPVKLSVRVWPREPRLSDLVEMEVAVESQPDVDVKPPAFGQAVGDFLIRDYSERPRDAASPNTRRFRYQLEPAHAGKHLIRSVSIEFTDRRPNSEGRGEPALIETDPLEVNVTSELGDEAPSLANLEPMLPPEPVPGVFSTGWLVVIAGAVALVVIFVVIRRRRKRRVIEPRRLTPEEIAHAALAALLQEDLPGRGLIKEFYLRLTGIVRQYIEDTTGLRAPEQTTEEFLRDMRSRAAFPPDQSVRLAEFLEAADMVKYAGQQPERGQIDDAIARAREFVTPNTYRREAQPLAHSPP